MSRIHAHFYDEKDNELCFKHAVEKVIHPLVGNYKIKCLISLSEVKCSQCKCDQCKTSSLALTNAKIKKRKKKNDKIC